MKILRIIYLSIVLSMTGICSHAQNLIPNYSFEVYDTCPISAGQIYYTSPWTAACTNSSTDYYNACNGSGLSVPGNFAGNENAKDGNAYVGLLMFAAPSGGNVREYSQVQLTSALLSSTCYRAVFYVSVGEEYKYAVTNFGAYFSATAVTSCDQCILPFTPQINYIDTAGIGNSAGWYKVEKTFMAAGGEQFMTIGNFNPDVSTTTRIINLGKPDYAYYFIDSVSLVQVVCDTGIGVNENTASFSFSLFPNPNNGNISLQYALNAKDEAEIHLFDITGKIINSFPLNNTATQTDVNTELPNGIYFYTIIVNNKLVQSDKLVIIKD